jgi:invasion protein IalB
MNGLAWRWGGAAVICWVLMLAVGGTSVWAQTPLPTRPAARPPAPAPAAPTPAPPAQAAPSAQAPAAPAQPQAEAAPPAQVPTRTEILNFENWVVTCNEFGEGARTRVCSALLRLINQNTKQIVFTWTIALDNNKQWITVMQTLTGVAIPPGVELRVGKAAPHKIPYASCDTGGCIATSVMDTNLVREMTTTPTAEAVIQSNQGTAVPYNIQMKGFDRAFAILSRS